MELDMAISSRRDFNEEVTRAIDATLSEIMGEHKKVVYMHLKDLYDIGPGEMPDRLPTIIRVLEEMFGVVGTIAIGSDVAKKLYSQLGLKFVERSNFTLKDYMEEALKLLPKP
jgi:hypothetical protein